MKLLVTLYSMEQMKTLAKMKIAGLIFGGPFSLNYHFSFDEIRTISQYLRDNQLESYLCLDAFVHEHDLKKLEEYLDFIKEIDVDGIYYHDFAVLEAANRKGLKDKLIYDGMTMVNNSLDAHFYAKMGKGVVLSRELTLKEYQNILKRLNKKGDMQIFGHLRMSYSRRKFLTNYFDLLERKEDLSRGHYTISEEQRDYQMPIVEDDYGTRIYTDYVYALFDELLLLKDDIGRAIIDGLFLSDEIIYDFSRLYSEINGNNARVLKEMMANKYPGIDFNSGYLYLKTNKVKES
ncbi:MAG: U32 family peptidase [Erysipelotrichaceae bacterium]|nr:U32 family peptidase [Erysipelotrichaceae bacterium]